MVLSIVGQTHCVITQKNALIMVSCTDKTMKNKGLGNKNKFILLLVMDI